MVYYVYFSWEDQSYRFPIASNLLNGKLIHDLAIQYKLFPVDKYFNLWLEEKDKPSVLVNDATMIYLYPDGSCSLITDQWLSSYSSELERYLPTLDINYYSKPIFTFT